MDKTETRWGCGTIVKITARDETSAILLMVFDSMDRNSHFYSIVQVIEENENGLHTSCPRNEKKMPKERRKNEKHVERMKKNIQGECPTNKNRMPKECKENAQGK